MTHHESSGGGRVLATIAGVCLFVQITSATLIVRDLESPNAATRIARTLVSGGGFAIAPAATPDDTPVPAVRPQPRRAYQLPGEPVYLAVAFRLLPSACEPYLHVPVTLTLILAITAVALAAGGARVALLTGLIASLDPFVVIHGPVWDDLFLAAAAEWTLFAWLITELRRRSRGSIPGVRAAARRHGVAFAAVVCLAAFAALTRMQSQILLGGAGLAVLTVPSLRPVRWMGGAIILGIAVGLGLWGARNQAVLGTPLLGTTHDGKTLFESTYATARPTILEHGVAQNYRWERAPASLAGVELLDELEADRRFARAAWHYIRTNPLDVAGTGAFKIGVSLAGIDFGVPLASARNLLAIGTNATMLGLAGWGFWLWTRRPSDERRLVLRLAAIAGIVTLSFLAIGPVGLRYRISLAGFAYIGLAVWLLSTLQNLTPSRGARG